MALWSAPGSRSARWLRVVSALAITPPILAAVHFGTPYVEVLIALTALVMAWEWARLCGGGRLGVSGTLLVALVLAGLACGLKAGLLAATAFVAAGGLGLALWHGRRDRKAARWLAAGAVYLPLSCLGFLELRLGSEDGRDIAYWVLAAVWATDTGAYAAGRNLGGPKLAPAISPNKTWSGLAGGVLAAGLVGVFAVLLWDGANPWANPWIVIAASSGLALVAQAGDLFESLLKRRFGVKDASQLIPGHGGLLDRVDGLLAASLVVGLVSLK